MNIINNLIYTMKKLLLSLLLILSNLTFAIQTSITSSIFAGDVPVINNNNPTIPSSNTRRVRFLNRIDSNIELENALGEANKIFSSIMASEMLDLVLINAEVQMGEVFEFSIDEVCKVIVNYSDTLMDNTLYYYFNQYLYSDLPILIPKAISNQASGSSDGCSMLIKLNPQVSYYFGTSEEGISPNEYDAITILLRALVIGCGIQSTLNPYTTQFGQIYNGQKYINVFDYQIHNDLNNQYSDVANEYITPYEFLAGRLIFANGYGDRYASCSTPVQLFNDWYMSNNYTDLSTNTLNTIDPISYTDSEIEDGFCDLMDPQIPLGYTQRTITPYTMRMLRGIGWIKTTPVGNENYLYNFYDSKLTCSSNILLPNNTYSISLSSSGVINNLSCELESTDSLFEIGTFQTNNSFSYHSIPANIQWRRNPSTKNIIGHIRGTASMLVDEYYEIEKICDIEIPYKPEKISVQKSETEVNGNVMLDIHAYSNGSSSYTVSYIGASDHISHSFTTSTNPLDTIIEISGSQLYNLSVFGSNTEGNSDTCSFTFGFSTHPYLYMSVSVMGNVLKYDLSYNGMIDVSNLVISHVQISDSNGGIYPTPLVGSGEPIDISGLTRGYYVLTVIADGNTYSRLFIKR